MNRLTASIAVLLIVLASRADCFAKSDKSDKPNFLFLLADDLGYMDIGPNNPDCFYDTPALDELAGTGMRFTDGYAANPVCSPTRYSLMTGRYPTRVMATNFFVGKRSGRFNPAPLADKMPLEDITLAELLKPAGYRTFFAGKWHLGPTETHWPLAQGFDVNVGGHSRGGPYTGNKYFSPFKNPTMKDDGSKGDHLPQRLARETIAFMKAQKAQGKPFLAYLSFYSVHTPLIGREDLIEKYKKKIVEKGLTGKEAFGDEEQVWPANLKGKGKRKPKPVGKTRKVRQLQAHATYAAMVEGMDVAIGMLLKALKEEGLDDNTVVMFTSDNGGLSTSEGSPTSNLPLRGGKGWVYEGGIREPWLIRWPGKTKPGSQSSVPICSIDVYPTIAEMAGVAMPNPDKVDGLSLAATLKDGKTSLNREALYWHYPHYSNQGGIPGGAIRMGDFKLFERYEDGRVHLFNLADDLGEKKDLAAEMPEKVAMMRKKLHAWYKDVDAKFLQPKPDGNAQPWRPE